MQGLGRNGEFLVRHSLDIDWIAPPGAVQVKNRSEADASFLWTNYVADNKKASRDIIHGTGFLL